MTRQHITVYKRDHHGQPVWTYSGLLVERAPSLMVVEAYFDIPDRDDGYFIWQQGDRMLEWYYADRWYNVMQIFDRATGTARGWYCNISRPATLAADHIIWEDLVLDVFVYPDGRLTVKDEVEFAALDLRPEERAAAYAAVDALQALVRAGAAPFERK